MPSKMYMHWRNDHPNKPHRSRIHLASSKTTTICGYNIKEKELIRVSETAVQTQEIQMCSNCMKQLQIIDPASLKKYPHGKPTRNKGTYQSKTKQSETDKIVHPKLSKFKKIIHSAKEQKDMVNAAIETALEAEEENIPAMTRIQKMIPDLSMFLRVAQTEAHIEWEKDSNRFNDTKHFHLLTTLRNFALAIDSIEDL